MKKNKRFVNINGNASSNDILMRSYANKTGPNCKEVVNHDILSKHCAKIMGVI